MCTTWLRRSVAFCVALVGVAAWPAGVADAQEAVVVVVDSSIAEVHPNQVRRAIADDLGTRVYSPLDRMNEVTAPTFVVYLDGTRRRASVRLTVGTQPITERIIELSRNPRDVLPAVTRACRELLGMPVGDAAGTNAAATASATSPIPPPPPPVGDDAWVLPPDVLDPFRGAQPLPLSVLVLEVIDPWSPHGAGGLSLIVPWTTVAVANRSRPTPQPETTPTPPAQNERRAGTGNRPR